MVVLWSAAHLYGLYCAATGIGNAIPSLIILTGACIGLVALMWHSPLAPLLTYELGVFGIWMGFFVGSTSFTNYVDVQWFCMLFWPWFVSAFLGGAVLAVKHKRGPCSAAARVVRTFVLLMFAVAAGLLAYALVSLTFFENPPIAAFSALQTFSLKDVALSANGEVLATIGGAGQEQQVTNLWDAITGDPKAQFTVEEERQKCVAVHFMDNPPGLAVAYSSPVTLDIRIWDIPTGQVQRHLQWDDELDVRKPVFSRNGEWFVYANSNGHLRVFDLKAGEIRIDVVRSEPNVRCLAVNRPSGLLACGTWDQTLEVWEVAGEQHNQLLELDKDVLSIDFSRDGCLLACGTEDGSVEVVEMNALREGTAVQRFEEGSVHSVAFSPDGKMLACGVGDSGLTKLVETSEWHVVHVLRNWGAWQTPCVGYSPEGERLVTGGALRRVAIWDVTSLKPDR